MAERILEVSGPAGTITTATPVGQRDFGEYHRMMDAAQIRSLFFERYPLAMAHMQKVLSRSGEAYPILSMAEIASKVEGTEEKGNSVAFYPYSKILLGVEEGETNPIEIGIKKTRGRGRGNFELRVIVVESLKGWASAKLFQGLTEDEVAYIYYAIAHLIAERLEVKYDSEKRAKRVDIRGIIRDIKETVGAAFMEVEEREIEDDLGGEGSEGVAVEENVPA